MRAYNIDVVVRKRKDSMGILNISGDVNNREVKKNYRKIARIYHPDKHCSASTRISSNQAEENFRLVNNAYEFLRSNANDQNTKHQGKGKHRLNSFNNRDEYYYYLLLFSS